MLYKKNPDGTFEPVGIMGESIPEYDLVPIGCHITIVSPNEKFTRYQINPDFVALQAAAIKCETYLAKLLIESSRCDPPASLSPEAVKAVRDLLGSAYLNFPSAADVAQRFLEHLQNVYIQTHENSWVRDLAEQYKTAILLTQTTDNK